ncbi:hypothetical protein F5Y13DRAFT_206147 [Hypoxylon sp. FL1857]|nr:hypothetical protein F5Y13DRAFT_206147 [Hypoxylon sp. FL1857]
MATLTHRKADRASAFLRKGQAFYASQQYDQAEKALLKAMDMCSCGVDVQNQPRIDHEILKGIEEKKLKEVLMNLLASSRRCNSPVHVDALDSLIATYEMQSRLDEGLEFALKMVNLSPREPKSYLRLGKVLRLKNLPTTAYYNYKQGIELVKRRNPHHVLLQKLQAQKAKVLPLATFDPLATLPIELVRMIFKHLDFKALCVCLRVSKTWKTVLTAEPLKSFWQVQEYKLTGNSRLRRIPLGFKSYMRHAAGAVTELSIHNCASFFQFCTLQQVLVLAPQLRVLKLREHRGEFRLEEMPGHVKLPRLTTLFLGGDVIPSQRLVRQLIDSSCNSLEELSIFSTERRVNPYALGHMADWPKCEKLKVLRLSYHLGDFRGFLKGMSNIEEVWLDVVHADLQELNAYWPKLRSIFIGRHTLVHYNPMSHGPVLREEIREVHVESVGHLLHAVRNVRLPPRLPMLEKLSILDHKPLEQPFFECFVRPSLESGTLRELDIRPLPVRDFQQLVLLDWFRSDSVTYLSLTGFTRDGLHEDRMLEEGVLAIVRRFPNLRSVDIGQELFPDTLLAKLIQNGVRTIYCRPGQPRIDLRDWASSKFGAEIIMRPPPHLPSAHPDRQTRCEYI